MIGYLRQYPHMFAGFYFISMFDVWTFYWGAADASGRCKLLYFVAKNYYGLVYVSGLRGDVILRNGSPMYVTANNYGDAFTGVTLHVVIKDKTDVAVWQFAYVDLIIDGNAFVSEIAKVDIPGRPELYQAGCMVDALISINNVCVVTNSIYIAYKLYTGNPKIEVYVCGGNVGNEGPIAGIVGSLAEILISKMRAGMFFMGASGIHPEQGITDPYINSASIKRCMMDNAQQTVLLCDHTKFGTVCRAFVAPLSRVDVLITDAEADDPVVKEMDRLLKKAIHV